MSGEAIPSYEGTQPNFQEIAHLHCTTLALAGSARERTICYELPSNSKIGRKCRQEKHLPRNDGIL
jgi:hypothetical protein